LPLIAATNANDLYQLSQAFGVFELSSRCGELVSDLQTVGWPLSSLGARLATNCFSHASDIGSFRRDFPVSLSGSLFSCLEQVEKLCIGFETRLTLSSSACVGLRSTIHLDVSKRESQLENELPSLKSTCTQFHTDINKISAIPRMEEDRLDGIVSELKRKHCATVHRKEIVFLTSSSKAAWCNETGHWIC
jgi:hypothetical protein